MTGDVETHRLPGLAAGMIRRRAEKQFRTDFERLKLILES